MEKGKENLEEKGWGGIEERGRAQDCSRSLQLPNYTLMRSALINGVNSAEENKEGVGIVVCLMQAMIVIQQRHAIMTKTVERNKGVAR